MKNQLLTATSILFFVKLLIACDAPTCKNNNAIFNQSPPSAEEYKAELARQIKQVNPDDLTYTFNNYQQMAGQEYLEVQVQGDQLCATALVLVKDWGKLAGIKRTAGKGYRGAELHGLEIEVLQAGDTTLLAYKDVKEVID